MSASIKVIVRSVIGVVMKLFECSIVRNSGSHEAISQKAKAAEQHSKVTIPTLAITARTVLLNKVIAQKLKMNTAVMKSDSLNQSFRSI